jgi:hypothetical protein
MSDTVAMISPPWSAARSTDVADNSILRGGAGREEWWGGGGREGVAIVVELAYRTCSIVYSSGWYRTTTCANVHA